MEVKLQISEIFKSLQGEGPLLGKVAIFLRLAGCNLSCTWCDTAYARSSGTSIHVRELLSELLRLLAEIEHERPLLVVTGGEPLLQARALRVLLRELRRENPRVVIQVETNGTLSPSPILDLVDYFVVSPKLANSGNPLEKRRLHPDWRALVKSSRPEVYLKFVIDKPEDLTEVLEILQSLGISRDRVYLMPQCRSVSEQLSKLRWISEIAVKYSLNVTPRLQYLAGIR